MKKWDRFSNWHSFAFTDSSKNVLSSCHFIVIINLLKDDSSLGSAISCLKLVLFIIVFSNCASLLHRSNEIIRNCVSEITGSSLSRVRENKNKSWWGTERRSGGWGIGFQNQICPTWDQMRSWKGRPARKPAKALRPSRRKRSKNSGAYPSLTFAGDLQGVKARRDNKIFPREFEWQHLAEVGTSFEALPSRVLLTHWKGSILRVRILPVSVAARCSCVTNHLKT